MSCERDKKKRSRVSSDKWSSELDILKSRGGNQEFLRTGRTYLPCGTLFSWYHQGSNTEDQYQRFRSHNNQDD